MAAQLLFGTGNSVTFGSLNGTGFNSGGTSSFSKSSLGNMQVGDLLVAWLGGQDASASTVVTPPSGWTRYGAAPGVPSYTSSRNSGFWYYPLITQQDIDNLPATITWTLSSLNGRGGFVVARATGVNLAAIEDSAATAFVSGGGSASFSITSINTVHQNTLLVGGAYRHNSAGTTVPTCTNFMTGFQEYNTTPTSTPTVASTSAIMGYETLSSAGTTGPRTITFDGVASIGGELVAFTALDSGGIEEGYPYIVGTATTYVTATDVTSFTISTPSGLQDGDALILALSAQSPNVITDFACSGWQRISQPFVPNEPGTRIIAFYAMPVAVAANVSQPDFTFSSTDYDTGGRIAAEMFIVRGAELSNLTDGYSPYSSIGTQTITVTQPNTGVAKDLVLTAYNAQFVYGIDYTVGVEPVGFTRQSFLVSSIANESKTTLAVYRCNVAAAGPVPAATLTWNGSPTQSAGVSVAIRPLGAFPPNRGLDIHYTSSIGTLAKGKISYTSATDTLSTPAELRIVPAGYSSVANMLAQSPFYVAHRGGSKNWPEMSLHAYTQSVFWGVGALELSLARTSDGVWFGLHDASLDRTTLNSGGGSGTLLVASTMTWAQVQAYAIQYPSVTNSSSLPKPYMRWEEIIAAYYPSHVIFVDPKYANSYTNELLDMMDALPGTPTDHFVAKSYGQNGNVGNTTGWPHDAAAHGYKSWGYFYEADFGNGNLATYQARYDILGMDYTASGAAWSAALSYGQPVIGHIVPSSSAATTALGFGASGLMVSSVQLVVPRSSNPSQA